MTQTFTIIVRKPYKRSTTIKFIVISFSTVTRWLESLFSENFFEVNNVIISSSFIPEPVNQLEYE